MTNADIAGLIERLLAASHDERLSTGGLYQEAANALTALVPVPREPTEAMIGRGLEYWYGSGAKDDDEFAGIWRAMYDAALVQQTDQSDAALPSHGEGVDGCLQNKSSLPHRGAVATGTERSHSESGLASASINPSIPVPASAASDHLQHQTLVEEIDVFLAGFPDGKPAAGFRFGELLQRARDEIVRLKDEGERDYKDMRRMQANFINADHARIALDEKEKA